MEKFRLEKYLENPSKKIITRDGRPARIICTDVENSGERPIIALVRHQSRNGEFYECAYKFTKNGNLFENSINNEDLFFASNERSMWTFIYNIAADYGGEETLATSLYKNKENAEEAMKRLHGFGLTEITWQE